MDCSRLLACVVVRMIVRVVVDVGVFVKVRVRVTIAVRMVVLVRMDVPSVEVMGARVRLPEEKALKFRPGFVPRTVHFRDSI